MAGEGGGIDPLPFICVVCLATSGNSSVQKFANFIAFRHPCCTLVVLLPYNCPVPPCASLPAPPPFLPGPQVKTLQDDLQVQTVWDNIWGVVQVVFLPGGKVMTVHKPGELHVYDSIFSKSQVGREGGRGGKRGKALEVRWLKVSRPIQYILRRCEGILCSVLPPSLPSSLSPFLLPSHPPSFLPVLFSYCPPFSFPPPHLRTIRQFSTSTRRCTLGGTMAFSRRPSTPTFPRSRTCSLR